jgi:DNA-binding transcriptional MerR regulator/methylmalonyl-CoA mutase cobalamin-binding subunit
MRRLDLDALPDEHLQPLRRATKCIAFWHIRQRNRALFPQMSAGLNIAALSRRTGVAPDTLRKWEQRYQILRPTRTAGGQRRYSERDVARVEWLCERLREGYRIGEAASLLGTTNVAPRRTPSDHLQTILAAVGTGDAAQIGLLVDQAFALYGVDESFDGILRPLLQTVGDRWEREGLTVAEEHLVSEAVRSRLGHLLADTGSGVRATAVLACAPGERHELGLMMLAIALRRDGWTVVYLGADTPLEAAIELARRHAARILGISVGTKGSADGLAGAATQADDIEVVIGGSAASAELAKGLRARYVGGGPLADAVTALRALAA